MNAIANYEIFRDKGCQWGKQKAREMREVSANRAREMREVSARNARTEREPIPFIPSILDIDSANQAREMREVSARNTRAEREKCARNARTLYKKRERIERERERKKINKKRGTS